MIFRANNIERNSVKPELVYVAGETGLTQPRVPPEMCLPAGLWEVRAAPRPRTPPEVPVVMTVMYQLTLGS